MVAMVGRIIWAQVRGPRRRAGRGAHPVIRWEMDHTFRVRLPSSARLRCQCETGRDPKHAQDRMPRS